MLALSIPKGRKPKQTISRRIAPPLLSGRTSKTRLCHFLQRGERKNEREREKERKRKREREESLSTWDAWDALWVIGGCCSDWQSSYWIQNAIFQVCRRGTSARSQSWKVTDRSQWWSWSNPRQDFQIHTSSCLIPWTIHPEIRVFESWMTWIGSNENGKRYCWWSKLRDKMRGDRDWREKDFFLSFSCIVVKRESFTWKIKSFNEVEMT